MISPYVQRKRNIIFGILCMLACVVCKNPQYDLMAQVFYVLCSYYSCYLVVAFMVWGQYIRIRSKHKQKGFCVITIFCWILSFLTGMQSIRQLIVMVFPMCLMEFWNVCCSIVNKKNFSKKTLMFVSSVAMSNLLGMIVIKMLDIPCSTIYGDFSIVDSVDGFWDNCLDIVKTCGRLFGALTTDIAVKSFLTGFVFLVLFGMIKMLKDNRTALFELAILMLSSVLVVVGGKLVSNMELRYTYLFMWFPLVCIIVVYILEMCAEKYYSVLLGVVCACCFWSYHISALGDIDNEIKKYNIIRCEATDVVEWMNVNEYSVIYGLWNVSSKIALASNGDIMTASWANDTEEDMFVIDRTLVNTDLLEDSNLKAVYMVSKDKEDIFLRKAKETTMVLELPIMNCRLYTSTEFLIKVEE